ncbi:MAG TPA: hypothetical protein VKT31_04415 [Solirubrobacteraceae bacterium]|nr:hypothetical protein [Solirubrobacteraceae bacterium]
MTARLEERLTDLAAALELPQTPDLVPAVIARLPERPRRPSRPPARVLVLGFATALVLAGAALAVPPSRHAILRVLGLQGVRIVRVHRLPPVPRHPRPLRLGARISPAGARHAADFRALEPPNPTAVYLAHDVPGGRISILAGQLLIVEFRGSVTPYIYKLIAGGTVTRRLRVNGAHGLYISGSPHELLLADRHGNPRMDTVRLEGNVLVWQQGAVTLRIEGARTLSQALALAHTLR